MKTKKPKNPSISLHGPLGLCTILWAKRMGPVPQVLPLSANRVTREGSGHLAMPPCRLPMVHQPIRFHIVLDEALRVAGGEKRETEREKKRGRVLDQVLLKHSYWPSICMVAVFPKLDSSLFIFYSFCVQLWGNCLFTWVTEVFSQQC